MCVYACISEWCCCVPCHCLPTNASFFVVIVRIWSLSCPFENRYRLMLAHGLASKLQATAMLKAQIERKRYTRKRTNDKIS